MLHEWWWDGKGEADISFCDYPMATLRPLLNWPWPLIYLSMDLRRVSGGSTRPSPRDFTPFPNIQSLTSSEHLRMFTIQSNTLAPTSLQPLRSRAPSGSSLKPLLVCQECHALCPSLPICFPFLSSLSSYLSTSLKKDQSSRQVGGGNHAWFEIFSGILRGPSKILNQEKMENIQTFLL